MVKFYSLVRKSVKSESPKEAAVYSVIFLF